MSLVNASGWVWTNCRVSGLGFFLFGFGFKGFALLGLEAIIDLLQGLGLVLNEFEKGR